MAEQPERPQDKLIAFLDELDEEYGAPDPAVCAEMEQFFDKAWPEPEAEPEPTVMWVTVRYLFDRDLWSKACDITGRDRWAVNEASMTDTDTVPFTATQAAELGLAP